MAYVNRPESKLSSHEIVHILQEKATLLEHAKDVTASLSVEALVILFWHGCWSLLDKWSASIGLDQPCLELDDELDRTISSWYAVVRNMQAIQLIRLLELSLPRVLEWQ